MFVIPVGTGQDALTAGVIQTMVSNSAWSVSQPAELNTSRATFILGPSANTDTVTLAAGAAIVIRFYGFLTHDEPGTATIAITRGTQKPTANRAGFFHRDDVSVGIHVQRPGRPTSRTESI